MYIAFKWLTGLALAMWLAMCIMDIFIKNKDYRRRGLGAETFGWTHKNTTLLVEEELVVHDPQAGKLYEKKFRRYDPTVLHYAMFFAGAIAVSVFNKKREILSYTKNTIARIDFMATANIFTLNLKKTAALLFVAIYKYSVILGITIQKLASRIRNYNLGMKTDIMDKHKRLNIILLKKLKEFGEERRKLGQLLIASIQENKNIRIQFQLENMAKNRLVRHIEDTQQKIKENRTKYVSFQHLYLVTHQENIFLKARIRKITVEKENAEKDLMAIINEVYQSNNDDLKNFCSRFIVCPRENLLNSDAGAEVQKFLQKASNYPTGSTSSWHVPSQIDGNNLSNSAKARVTEILEDDTLVPLVSDSPKLRGLPGECIWTVKDKDGIIEKLYEYDYESDFDNGDTIRRIREYSVYYDKDCLLDFACSRTLIAEPIPVNLSALFPTSRRFLTGSEAFQKFMQDNKNKLPKSSKSHPPLLLC